MILFAQSSYSQRGEDRIIKRLLEERGITKPFYLDIGCGNPTKINNTYLFYLQGGKGICIDATNHKFEYLLLRSRDKFINCLLSTSNKEEEFLLTNVAHRNTSNESEIKELIEKGCLRINERVLTKPVTIVELAQILPEKIDLLSIDIEGKTIPIMKEILLHKIRPTIVCLELSRENNDFKQIIEIFSAFEYFMGGYTNLNTIFVDSQISCEELATYQSIKKAKP